MLGYGELVSCACIGHAVPNAAINTALTNPLA
jgi:hypothetical protein